MTGPSGDDRLDALLRDALRTEAVPEGLAARVSARAPREAARRARRARRAAGLGRLALPSLVLLVAGGAWALLGDGGSEGLLPTAVPTSGLALPEGLGSGGLGLGFGGAMLEELTLGLLFVVIVTLAALVAGGAEESAAAA